MSSFFQEDEIIGKAYDARLMRRLLTYLAPYRLRVAAIVGMLFAGAMVDLAGPYIIKRAIDDVIPPALGRTGHPPSQATTEGYHRDLLLYVVLFLGAVMLSLLINYV